MVQMGRPVRVHHIINITFIVNSTIRKVHEREHFRLVVVRRLKLYRRVVVAVQRQPALVYLDQYLDCMLQRQPINQPLIGNEPGAYHPFQICNKAMAMEPHNPII